MQLAQITGNRLFQLVPDHPHRMGLITYRSCRSWPRFILLSEPPFKKVGKESKARGGTTLREDCCPPHTSTKTAFIMPSPLDNPRRHVQVFPERVGAVSIGAATLKIPTDFHLQTGRWLRVPWTLPRRRPLLESPEV